MTNTKIKFYLITGFLGAGKTTLLQGLLNMVPHDEGGKPVKTGVIVNEFGKVSIDGSVINKDGLKLVEINNGSIFCKCLEGSFIEHIAALAKMSIDYLFVEGSGLSDPTNMGDIFHQANRITGDVFSFEGTICVVDALNFMKILSSLSTAGRQVLHSDFVIVNKTDLVDKAMLDKVAEKITEINPMAKIIKTSFCKLNEDILKKDIKTAKNLIDVNAKTLNTPFNRPQTLLIKTDRIIDRKGLIDFIDEIMEKALRVKGFVRFADGLSRLDVVGKEVALAQTDLQKNNSEVVIISKPDYEIKEYVRRSWLHNVGEGFTLE